MSLSSGSEDVDMADCLQALGVFPAESQKRLRFGPGYPLAYLRGVLGEGDKGRARMWINESITFHYVSPAEMLFIDSLVNLRELNTI